MRRSAPRWRRSCRRDVSPIQSRWQCAEPPHTHNPNRSHNQTTRTSENNTHTSLPPASARIRATLDKVVSTCHRSSQTGNARIAPHTQSKRTKQTANPRTSHTSLALLLLRRSAPLSRRSCRRDMTPIKSNWPFANRATHTQSKRFTPPNNQHIREHHTHLSPSCF